MTFGPKLRTRIGFWNVRTLLESSKLYQVAKELHEYKIGILGLSEIRWKGFGDLSLTTGDRFLFSGVPEESDRHRNGVAFLINKKLKDSLLDWDPVSERIIRARFKSKVRKISIVQCYAPTEDADIEIKEQFYDALTSTVRKIKKQDVLIVMGDLNAKIGSDNKDLELIMGRHSLGNRNENGELFTEFCSQHRLVIGGSLFPHKNIHKETWISPDGFTRNQIDHFAISHKWKTSLLDTRVMRGADIDSDHLLGVATIRAKLAAIKKSAPKSRKYDVSKLSKPTCQKDFKLSVRNRFEILSSLDEANSDVNTRWEAVRNIYTKTCDEFLSSDRRHKKHWMSDDSWNFIERRKAVRLDFLNTKNEEEREMLLTQIQDLRQKIKKSVRRDKRRKIEILTHTAEEAAKLNDSRTIYRVTRTLSKKNLCTYNKPIKDREGKILVNPLEQLQRWEQHFSEVLECGVVENSIAPEEEFICLDNIENDETKPPSFNEVRSAITFLKDRKAAGIDNLPGEVFKVDKETSAKLLHPIITSIWNYEKLPEDWNTGVLIKLPKKGDLSKCDNYRGITLLCTASKVLTRIIHNRLEKIVEATLRKEQNGFRKNRSCVDHINTLRILIEQSREMRCSLYLTFIDFRKAFDKVKRSAIWEALERRGVPKKLISLVKALYKNYKFQVRHVNELSDPISATNGVRQGCILSPLLFLITLDDVLEKINANKGRGIQWGLFDNLSDIDYADDVCLLSHTFENMADLLTDLNLFAKDVGLEINYQKTVEMRVNPQTERPLYIGSEIIKRVTDFCYLGAVVDRDGGALPDIKTRINKAKGAFSLLHVVWTSSQLSLRTKIRIFNSNVKSVLLYACETWLVTKNSMGLVQRFVNRCLRRIINIRWPELISNTKLWEKTFQIPISTQIRRRKWNWIGHILRRDDDNIAKAALDWNPQGSRKRGRPAQTWRRSVNEEAKLSGLSWRELKAVAKNRVRWRRIVAALSP